MIVHRDAAWTPRRALFCLALLVPGTLMAQRNPLPGGDGYLFARPRGTLTLRTGLSQPTASSDVFSHSSQFLTLRRGSYRGVSFGVELTRRVDEKLDLMLSAAYSFRDVGSEFRDYIDNADAAIEQSTNFKRVPLTMGLKYFLTAPGRSVGQMAWVPARVSSYVSVGGGWVWYRFNQSGDFVDFQDMGVFNTSLTSQSWTPTAFAAAGVEYSVLNDTAINTELRFDAARGRMNGGFLGFNRIDLSGVSATVGLTFRY